MTPTRRQLAAAIAGRCADAYSANRYRSWTACARTALALGFDEYEAEALLRSKATRWAADFSGYPYGKVPATVLRAYVESEDATADGRLRREVAEWAAEYRNEGLPTPTEPHR